ncbi:UDP-N-acetylmuramate dehydrogenase [Sphingobacterium sp. PCS056]|uniref:UDP-N-acetylmuramate dehydrogenase n=1 Tax=Sphingobacterium sp. PCS056 TaxID=2931400 RepID=UPI00200CB390|nr:UDP-N-acetylmuramate dehydrogenase [Sphingobacterium sp. PCS056]UPZ37843.1 UDP-N-acetylmuramate dehydrogenase [Sphingobacterium sp. PCS056]
MEIKYNFDLTPFNSYRLNATCQKAIFPSTEDDILQVFTEESNYVLIGSGHNIILSKSFYDETFIILTKTFDSIQVFDDILEVEAGAWMTDLAVKAQELGLSGLEVFYDIPSSLGGAIVMNAGASGYEIKDVLLKVRYLDLQDMQIKEILKEDMSFEYRNSFFQRNTDKVVLKAWLQLERKDCESVQLFMDEIKTQRWAKQPKDLPNAGSVFKRPKGYFVGAIIDELNLKGYTVGGAKISEKHGGFIVNFNQATGEDIIRVIEHVKKCVFERFQVDLEIEQRII